MEPGLAVTAAGMPGAERARLGEAIAQTLAEGGRLEAGALDRARRLAGQGAEPLDRLLVKLGLASEREVAGLLAQRLGLELATAEDYPDLPVLDERISLRFLREHGVLPLDDRPDGLVVAMVDPLDAYARAAVEMVSGRPVRLRVAVPGELEAAIERLHGQAAGIGRLAGMPGPDDGSPAGPGGEDGLDLDVERLKDLASEAPVIRMVNHIIARAVEQRASDVHIEPFETSLRVRYRIDGVLQEAESPPSRLRAAIVSRIKILARLDIAERRLPQDGRIKLAVRGTPIDLRVSTMPALHGESVVLRILDSRRGTLDFAALGIGGPGLERYLSALERPFGVFLVTGPTGSGKTTTLYASLTRINGADRKVLTVEDPVEYQLDGIMQVQVKPSIGLDFANVLRSMLRQDPDVILVGEIRDGETAQVAVQAALTGHLVLSTLHTNTAAAAVTRLLDMGVEDYLLASVLNGAAGQRLVRRLCPHCREPYRPLPELVGQLRLDRFAPGADIVLHRPRGCPECHGTGYSGRTAIVEVLAMTDTLRQLVMRRTAAAELHRAAVAGGMTSMLDDGLAKAVAGLTTVEEVLRVTRDA